MNQAKGQIGHVPYQDQLSISFLLLFTRQPMYLQVLVAACYSEMILKHALVLFDRITGSLKVIMLLRLSELKHS